ncbi:MAG: hypothetical protein HEQ32_06730 [Vampirovibrio sp.]
MGKKTVGFLSQALLRLYIKPIYNTLAKKTKAPEKEYNPQSGREMFNKKVHLSSDDNTTLSEETQSAPSFTFNKDSAIHSYIATPKYLLDNNLVKNKGDKLVFFGLGSERSTLKDKPSLTYNAIVENKDGDNTPTSTVGQIMEVYKTETSYGKDPKVTKLNPTEIAEFYKKMEKEANSNEDGNPFVYSVVNSH